MALLWRLRDLTESFVYFFLGQNHVSLASVCNSNSPKSVIAQRPLRSMRRVVNNAQLLRNETPLGRSTFISFRSTSPLSRDEFSSPNSAFPFPREIVRRSRAPHLRLFIVAHCIPRPTPALSHPLLLIADGIKKYLKYPEYTSAETPFVGRPGEARPFISRRVWRTLLRGGSSS